MMLPLNVLENHDCLHGKWRGWEEAANIVYPCQLSCYAYVLHIWVCLIGWLHECCLQFYFFSMLWHLVSKAIWTLWTLWKIEEPIVHMDSVMPAMYWPWLASWMDVMYFLWTILIFKVFISLCKICLHSTYYIMRNTSISEQRHRKSN